MKTVTTDMIMKISGPYIAFKATDKIDVFPCCWVVVFLYVDYMCTFMRLDFFSIILTCSI